MATGTATAVAQEYVCGPGRDTLEGQTGQCLGTHLLVEMWSAPFSMLADARLIEKVLDRVGVGDSGTGENGPGTNICVHQFDPYGVSGTASNHAARILIHTWPENKYAAIDIYTRGRDEAYLLLDAMKRELCPEYVHVLEMQRGQLMQMEDT